VGPYTKLVAQVGAPGFLGSGSEGTAEQRAVVLFMGQRQVDHLMEQNHGHPGRVGVGVVDDLDGAPWCPIASVVGVALDFTSFQRAPRRGSEVDGAGMEGRGST